MQQYAVCFILLQNHSTCFGYLPHPSSGVLKTVTAASGTGHNIGTATSLQRGQRNSMQSVLFYCKITLHVSGAYRTHRQEY